MLQRALAISLAYCAGALLLWTRSTQLLVRMGQDPHIAAAAGKFTLALGPALVLDAADQCCRWAQGLGFSVTGAGAGAGAGAGCSRLVLQVGAGFRVDGAGAGAGTGAGCSRLVLQVCAAPQRQVLRARGSQTLERGPWMHQASMS